MDLGFSEEQQMLKKAAHSFLTQECPKSLVRNMVQDAKGYTSDLWLNMAKLGWLGLVFPEKYGGNAGSLVDLAVLLEEIGRALLPGPYLPSVIGGLAVLEAGNEAQKKEVLSKLIKGDVILTVAITEPAAKYSAASVQMKASATKEGYTLSGTKLFIPDAHIAHYVVCACRTKPGTGEDGITAFLIDTKSRGISCTLLNSIGDDKLCELVFDGVQVSREAVLGEPNQGWRYLARVLKVAALAKCAEMVGYARQVLEMTVEYAKQRIQFDQPVGAFQAVQHHCANMAIDADGMELLTHQTACKLSEGEPCDLEVAMTKAWVSDACRRVVSTAHQILGGVGYMNDHDLPLYFKRAKAAELAFGDGIFHRAELAKKLVMQ